MDPNRLHLNFARPQGGNGQNDERGYQANNERVYPTTPSTFPQPVFSPIPGNAPNFQNQQGQVQSNSSYRGGNEYFNNQGYQAQYAQQHQQQQQQQQQTAYANQQQQYQQQPLSPGYAGRGYNTTNDPTSSLAHQFSNQHLGSSQQRQASPFQRQPSPGQPQRPATGGRGAGAERSYGSLLAPGGSNSSSATVASNSTPSESDLPPQQDFNKYSDNVAKRLIGLHVHVQAFFKENIARARERNTRALELEQKLQNPRLTEQQKKELTHQTWLKEIQHLRHLRQIESPNNYQTVKVIGKGAFGEVKLVKRKNSGEIYALKCLVKAEMFKKDQLAHVRAERDILAEADSPWVVKLHTTFQDRTFLYMLMEFLPGGDLMTMLIKYETFSPDIARFYMAEILLAIEAVHKLGFIHRDIKPDNILLDKTGHLKLTDFGLSTGFHKQHEASYYQQLLRGTSSRTQNNRQSVNLDQINLTVSNRGQINNWRKSRRTMAYSTVGTPDYIAPEIFGGQGYSFSCDWWSLGAIMYESVIGWPPFCADDPHDTYRKIVDWRNTMYIPDDLPQPLDQRTEDLIRSLLCDAPNRLGHDGGMYGASEIKQHPYFDNVNWDTMRQMQAPFQPQLSSEIDTEYFPIDDIDQTDHTAAWQQQAQDLIENHEAEMTLPFIGYTYKRFDAYKPS